MTRRYEPLLKIASGGTAAVYVGTAAGALGFRQLVAIKIPHAHLADDAAFRAALLEEAGIAARLHHANVVDVRDVEADDGGIQLVMDYVEGASLSELIRAWSKEPPARPLAVSLRIVLDACEGLRALHELTGDAGEPLGLVHRDISPANILVGLDGVARIADFGLAKSLLAVEKATTEGTLRGKIGYMAPEYVRGKPIDHRLDVFAMGVVLWEALAQKRLFRGENDADTLEKIQRMEAPSLGDSAELADLDAVVKRALAKDRDARFENIGALAKELERVTRAHDLATSHSEVRESFSPSLRAVLDDRRRQVIPHSQSSRPPPSVPVAVQASVAPPAPKRGAALPLVGVLMLLALGGGALLALRSAESALPARTAAVPSSDVEPLASDSNSRADAPEGAPSASAHPHHPHPADGNKAPRPNPYVGTSGSR